MSAFSIGEDFGLDDPYSPGVTVSASKPLDNPVSPQPKQKDNLREALMDLDDNGLDDEGGLFLKVVVILRQKIRPFWASLVCQYGLLPWRPI